MESILKTFSSAVHFEIFQSWWDYRNYSKQEKVYIVPRIYFLMKANEDYTKKYQR